MLQYHCPLGGEVLQSWMHQPEAELVVYISHMSQTGVLLGTASSFALAP